jgi:hypothetical protein
MPTGRRGFVVMWVDQQLSITGLRVVGTKRKDSISGIRDPIDQRKNLAYRREES